MPIKDKSLYPKDWSEIRERIKKRAGNRCEFCGVKNWAFGWRDREGTFHPVNISFGTDTFPERKIIRIVCTIAHLNHDPSDNSDSNLRFLCQLHHNRHDVNFRRHKPPQAERLPFPEGEKEE